MELFFPILCAALPLALLSALAVCLAFVWRGTGGYLPPHWDFNEKKRKERL